mmetsp:Transcript_5007/g.3645  ORF Transcript_5007/g.3645 Transcript_5007/m.3645 type:complete len:122 (-) Transcript_5007:175-540(-)
MFSKLRSYFDYSSKPFFYNIGTVNFNLDEIKHGLLRGNKKNPQAYMRTLGWNDQRTNFLKEMNDPRVLFVCLDFPEPIERIDSFLSEESLNEKLDSFVSDIINEKVQINSIEGELVLPKLF